MFAVVFPARALASASTGSISKSKSSTGYGHKLRRRGGIRRRRHTNT